MILWSDDNNALCGKREEIVKKKYTMFFLSTFFIFFFSINKSIACGFRINSHIGMLPYAETVFSGKIIGREKLDDYRSLLTIDVDNVYKGRKQNVKKLVVYSGSIYGDNANDERRLIVGANKVWSKEHSEERFLVASGICSSYWIYFDEGYVKQYVRYLFRKELALPNEEVFRLEKENANDLINIYESNDELATDFDYISIGHLLIEMGLSGNPLVLKYLIEILNDKTKPEKIHNSVKLAIAHLAVVNKNPQEALLTLIKTGSSEEINSLENQHLILHRIGSPITHINLQTLRPSTLGNLNNCKRDYDFNLLSKESKKNILDALISQLNNKNTSLSAASALAVIGNSHLADFIEFRGNERLISMLMDVLDDADKDLQKATIKVLGYTRAEKSIPKLKEIYKKISNDPRKSFFDNDLLVDIVKALGDIQSPAVNDFLMEIIKGEDSTIKHAAALSLASIGGEENYTVLVDKFNESSISMKSNFAEALSLFDTEESISFIEKSFMKGQINNPIQVARVLEKNCRLDLASDFYAAALDSRGDKIRAITFFAEHKNNKAIKPLIDFVKREGGSVENKITALYVLGTFDQGVDTEFIHHYRSNLY